MTDHKDNEDAKDNDDDACVLLLFTNQKLTIKFED